MTAQRYPTTVHRPRHSRGALFAVALFALASLATGGENPNPRGKSGPWVDGHRPHPSEIVVRFAKTASVEARAQLVRRLGLIERHSSANDYGVGVYDAPGRAPEFGTALRRASIIQAWGPAWIDPAGNLRHYVPGELTVQFEPGVAAGTGEAVIRELGARIVRREQVPGYYTITVPEGLDWAEAIRLFEAHDSVAFAEPSEIGFDDALLIPNDPLFGVQWHHLNTGQEGGTPGADISSTAAWGETLGSPNVVIAVIDTGAQLNHPDLAPNLLPRGNLDWDFTGSGRIPNDTNGHGTEVAGAAAAGGNNGVGVAGVCPLCSIMPLKVNLVNGPVTERVNAIHHLVDQALAHPERRYIGNCSWGLAGPSQALNTELQRAYDNGVPIFFATGNDNQGQIGYPASEPSVIAVGATSRCDERVSPTSCDAEEGWGSNYGTGLDLVAPGASIHTTCLVGGPNVACTPAGGYLDASGTSLAAPLAAGTAGLLLSANPQLNRAQIQTLLQARADDLVGPPAEDPPGPDIWMGWGRINADRVLEPIASCPATSTCSGCQPGAVGCAPTGPSTEQDLGYAECVKLDGELFSCESGSKVHLVTTECSKCSCCFTTPACVCPPVCAPQKVLICGPEEF